MGDPKCPKCQMLTIVAGVGKRGIWTIDRGGEWNNKIWGKFRNDFSPDLGQEGLAAVRRLFDEAEAGGIFPHSKKPLLAEERF